VTVPFELSARGRRTEEPPISWLMKFALEHPECISLAAGFVDYDTLPVPVVREIAAELTADAGTGREALQYGTTIGYEPLRRQIVDRLAREDGMTADSHGFTADNAVVTTGSQQLLFLISDVLLDPGDIVILGAPSYFVYMGILQSMGAAVRSVPMDGDGMDVDALDAALAEIDAAGDLHRVKLIYCVSYFQNPMGVSLSGPRRERIVEIAQRYSRDHRIFILEDAAYKELRFAEPGLPPIKTYDPTNEWVLYTGTFCKPFSAGLKVGFGILPEEVLVPVLRQKGNHDFGSANFNQMIVSRAIERGDYDRHVVTVREGYRHKKTVMADAIREHFPEQTRWYDPGGGLYIWTEFPPQIATGPNSCYFTGALERGVLYVPGEYAFYADSGAAPCRSAMRLSYGVAPADAVAEGAKRLGQLACELLDQAAALA